MAENLNNVTHEKEEENIGNLRKICFFSSIMKTVALITLDFISRDMNKDDMTKKKIGICFKTTGFGRKWAKILEKNL